MLNYIWAGLIIFSLAFALIQDSHDLYTNSYGNGVEYQVQVDFQDGGNSSERSSVELTHNQTTFGATWIPAPQGTEILISTSADIDPLWKKVAGDQDARNKDELRAVLTSYDASSGIAKITLPEVKFVKLRAITAAAFDMAETAVSLAIGLIGVMALWLGLMRIVEKSGLINIMVKVVSPVLGRLFPDVPKDHPALGAISLNLAANMLGLGNAATPLGIKAMEELQTLNKSENKESATNAMIMFLTMNTASVQLVVPVTLIALMGIRVGELFFSVFLATAISLTVGITMAKWFARRNPDPVASTVVNQAGEDN